MKQGPPHPNRHSSHRSSRRESRLDLARLKRALEYHQHGDTLQAQALYKKILRSQPEHFDALHLLGIAEYQSGNYGRAIEFISHAIRVNPGMAAPYANLGLAQQAQQHYADARRSYQRALEHDPQHIEALNNLGNLLRDLHDPQAALSCLDQALAIKPDYVSALNNRGNVLRDLQRYTEAIASYDAAIRLKPDHAHAYYNRGNALQDLQQYDAARLSYEQALRIKPEAFEAWINHGNVLREMTHFEAALASYEHAVRLKPDSAEALANRGSVQQHLRRHHDALSSYQLALRLKPDFAEALNGCGTVLRDLNRYQESLLNIEHALQLKPAYAHALNNLGVTLTGLGRLQEAQAAYRRAIDCAPENGSYYRNLVQAGPLPADDPYFVAMESLARKPEALSPDDRIGLHFAMGEALANLGRHEQSFAQYLQANALQRQRIHYPEQATLALLEWYRNTFTAEFLQHRQGAGDPSEAPIFVVGMPRSGSTLIEQILSSHPQVFGIGERREFVNAVSQFVAERYPGQGELQSLASLPIEQFEQIGHAYLTRLAEVAGVEESHRRIVDKSLLHFIHIGLIHLALPNARFIHSRRAPIETCLSCFSKMFDEAPFSYELGELGRYYRAYDALMAHWRAVLPPGVMLEIQYEELVTDFDAQARRMLDHCGLPWDDACTAFHRTQRAVGTSSAAQVRQPLYRHALTRWQPEASVLQPLLDGLGPILAGN